MTRIAISYRRDDSAAITGRIFDRLIARYGGDSVFRDVDNVPVGVDFREYINTMLAQTDITLVVVGKRWFGPLPRRRRRIDDPADPVRVEVETALRNGIPVVPVLVEGGGMPNVDQLPDSLRELVYRNGLEVDSGRDFDQHIERLIRNMEPILARSAKEQAEAARQAEEERQQTEAARQAEEEKRRAEKKRGVEAARQVNEEKQRAGLSATGSTTKPKYKGSMFVGALVTVATLVIFLGYHLEIWRLDPICTVTLSCSGPDEETRRAEAARRTEEEKRRAGLNATESMKKETIEVGPMPTETGESGVPTTRKSDTSPKDSGPPPEKIVWANPPPRVPPTLSTESAREYVKRAAEYQIGLRHAAAQARGASGVLDKLRAIPTKTEGTQNSIQTQENLYKSAIGDRDALLNKYMAEVEWLGEHDTAAVDAALQLESDALATPSFDKGEADAKAELGRAIKLLASHLRAQRQKQLKREDVMQEAMRIE